MTQMKKNFNLSLTPEQMETLGVILQEEHQREVNMIRSMDGTPDEKNLRFWEAELDDLQSLMDAVRESTGETE